MANLKKGTLRNRVLFPMTVIALAGCILGASFVLEGVPQQRREAAARSPADDSPRYRFRDVTRRAGVWDAGRTWGTAWTDFEGDGDADVFLGRHWREPLMFLNDGSGFQVMPTPDDLQGTSMDRHGCAWGEANRDARPDLLCTQGADNGQGRGPNELLINSGETLNDRAHRFGIKYSRARGRTVNWLDYDRDSDLDVFFGTTVRPGFPMAAFRNRRGEFVKARVGLSYDLSVLSSTWADWDGDGDPDLLVTQHYPFPTLAFENVRGREFRPVALPRITGRKWQSSNWGDFNADGWIDLQMASRKRLRIFRNRKGRLRPVFRTKLRQGRAGTWLDVDNDGDLDSFVVQGAAGNHPHADAVNWRDFLVVRKNGRFRRVDGGSFRGPENGNGEQATVADFDRDGRLDVFVTNGLHYYRGRTELLRNISRAGNWIGLDLEGSKGNPLGLGAVVVWKVGQRVFRRQLTDSVVFKGQSEVGYVHVGLGDAEVAAVKVRWPSGQSDCTTATAGTVLTVEKGSLHCP